MTTKTKTAQQREAEAEAERARAARRKRANDRLAALPETSRDAVRREAQRLEAAHDGPRVTAVSFLEAALDKIGAPEDAVGQVERAATKRAAKKQPAKPRPKGPREKSAPKEKGRPEPETKDPEALAANAKRARGGDPALVASVTVEVPDGVEPEIGDTAYCKSCDRQREEAEFWPKNRTEKSHRRQDCRECYNRKWREFDQARRANAAAAAAV